ncbi:hypothetical protein QFC21_004395 [Naganishia friedmannii]|uniref:Uncharacterized protein n=1 Tax=Naganishia friedmannii TaxID=89922 RepID=A0ACC2VJM3_9TREE|nr:hypothetical protein QFC21_004395 [Naganishia friedmannii]
MSAPPPLSRHLYPTASFWPTSEDTRPLAQEATFSPGALDPTIKRATTQGDTNDPANIVHVGPPGLSIVSTHARFLDDESLEATNFSKVGDGSPRPEEIGGTFPFDVRQKRRQRDTSQKTCKEARKTGGEPGPLYVSEDSRSERSVTSRRQASKLPSTDQSRPLGNTNVLRRNWRRRDYLKRKRTLWDQRAADKQQRKTLRHAAKTTRKRLSARSNQIALVLKELERAYGKPINGWHEDDKVLLNQMLLKITGLNFSVDLGPKRLTSGEQGEVMVNALKVVKTFVHQDESDKPPARRPRRNNSSGTGSSYTESSIDYWKRESTQYVDVSKLGQCHYACATLVSVRPSRYAFPFCSETMPRCDVSTLPAAVGNAIQHYHFPFNTWVQALCQGKQADDDDSSDDVTDDSSDDDDLYLEPGTVLRYYWFRYDIKYVVLVNGRKYFLTAEQLEENFGNVSYSLWHYWNRKRAGRTPYARIIDYLRHMGHYGFFREMVFHLAPSWLRRRLYAAQKNGTLKYLVIPDEAPKKPKRK